MITFTNGDSVYITVHDDCPLKLVELIWHIFDDYVNSESEVVSDDL